MSASQPEELEVVQAVLGLLASIRNRTGVEYTPALKESSQRWVFKVSRAWEATFQGYGVR